ncbi:MAG: hypothetical protein Q4F66_12945 [Clostridium sp.]|nr:hypothetical protein [Clostridium sp.]
MIEKIFTEEEIISAFNLMWEKYPEPVRLINKKFMIVAANSAYKALGGAAGVRCNTLGTPELHKGCGAMKSLKTQETQILTSEKENVKWTTYWIPVNESPDYFIHFTDGMNDYIKELNKAK